MRGLLLWSLTASVFLPLGPALAEPALVDQVERLDIRRGEAELEWQSMFADPAGGEARIALHLLSGEYALDDRFSLGFELGAADESGDDLSGEYLLLQAKYVVLDPEDAPVGFGLQASLGPALDGGDGEAELEILFEKRLTALAFATDIAVEAPLEAMGDAVTRYAARADLARRWGGLGLEIGGDIDSGDEAARHWFGPLVVFDPVAAFAVELGYFRGLNDDTPDNQFRIYLARTF
jgi:hypothetical protein